MAEGHRAQFTQVVQVAGRDVEVVVHLKAVDSGEVDADGNKVLAVQVAGTATRWLEGPNEQPVQPPPAS